MIILVKLLQNIVTQQQQTHYDIAAILTQGINKYSTMNRIMLQLQNQWCFWKDRKDEVLRILF